MATTANEVSLLRYALSRKIPVLASLFSDDQPLSVYVESLYDYAPNSIHTNRQKQIECQIASEVSRLWSNQVTPELPLTINIVDHHAPLTHPILVATNIIGNISRLFVDHNSSPIITFSCGNIPVNNYLNKRGFHFNGQSIPIFSSQKTHCVSTFMPKQEIDFVKRLQTTGRWDSFAMDDKAFLNNLNGVLVQLGNRHAKNYLDQVSLINHYVWKQLFDESIRGEVRDLYYLCSEEMFRLAFPKLLEDPNCIITQVLFEKQLRDLVLDSFEGVPGCWNVSSKVGTHFFWCNKSTDRLGAMRLQGDILVSIDGTYSTSLHKDEILEAILCKRIVPSMFLLYSWLVFWCGVRPLVGYASGTYLSLMKQKWLDVLSTIGSLEIERVREINTTGLIGGQKISYKRVGGKLTEQFALDIMYDGGFTREYLQKVSEMPVSRLVEPALPDIYKSYMPAEERTTLDICVQDILEESFNWVQ